METPDQLFSYLKGKANTIDDQQLNNLFQEALKMGNKYVATGQISALRKLIFVMRSIEKEHKLIELGINTFVYKDDLDFFIEDTKNASPVKIIELANYQREIPDEIVETIKAVKGIFDELYIVYTDYSGRDERRVEAEKRSKDPILFGVFIDRTNRVCVDRFYFIGDWVDEYCDLTMDKLLTKLAQHNRSDRTIQYPKTFEELQAYVKCHKEVTGENSNAPIVITPFSEQSEADRRPSWFSKVMSKIWKR